MFSMSEYIYLWCVISNMHADWPKWSSHWQKYIKAKLKIKADFMTLLATNFYCNEFAIIHTGVMMVIAKQL